MAIHKGSGRQYDTVAGGTSMTSWKILISILATFALAYLTGCSTSPTSRSSSAPLTELQMQTLSTFHRLDDFPLYEMHYYGDYPIHRLVPAGFRSDNSESGKTQGDPFDCTSFTALSDKGEKLFGKNFDWPKHPVLLLFTSPQTGYESISMTDLSLVGFSADKTTPQALRCLLQTVDFPLDGMNAAGLAVSYMTVSTADRGYDRGRMTIGGLDIVRIWLDYAGNVDDALALLSHYNLDFGGRPGHYLIADAAGNAAVVEFVEGEVKVTREHKPWQVAANFTVFTVEPEKRRSQSYRYLVTDQELERNEGNITMAQAFRLLQEVSQDHGPMPTQWSAVYNMSTGEVQVVMNRQYGQIHHFALKMRGE
jgi:hypothetical protein